MNIVKEIFFKRELTLTKSTAILNKYYLKDKSIDIDIEVARYLIIEGLLVEDSGSFEYGETHYVYNTEYNENKKIPNKVKDSLINILREIRLDKIIRD